MKPMFALQITSRDDDDLRSVASAIVDAGFEFIDFGIIPIARELTNVDAFPIDRPVIALGATLLLDMYVKKELPSNWRIFYDDPTGFDQQFMAYHYGSHLLNANAFYYPYKAVKDVTWATPKFIKPTNDGKVFAGTVVELGQTLGQTLDKVTHGPIEDTEMVLVAPVVDIGAEYRLFIVDGKPVDASEYRRAGHVEHKPVDSYTWQLLNNFFEAVRDPKAPPVYVMDVCEVPDGEGFKYKIVELNCFNCSGMYKVDRKAVMSAVADYVWRESK